MAQLFWKPFIYLNLPFQYLVNAPASRVWHWSVLEKYKRDVKCIAPSWAEGVVIVFVRWSGKETTAFPTADISNLKCPKELKRLKKKTGKQWTCSHSLMSTANNIPSECHAWLLSLYEWWVWLYHGGGGGLSRHPEFSAVSEAFSEQSINHLSSATVETFILDPG